MAATQAQLEVALSAASPLEQVKTWVFQKRKKSMEHRRKINCSEHPKDTVVKGVWVVNGCPKVIISLRGCPINPYFYLRVGVTINYITNENLTVGLESCR